MDPGDPANYNIWLIRSRGSLIYTVSIKALPISPILDQCLTQFPQMLSLGDIRKQCVTLHFIPSEPIGDMKWYAIKAGYLVGLVKTW